MKNNNLLKIIYVPFLISFLASCNSFETDKKKTPMIKKEHFNFIICSDLSNRLTTYKKTIHDSVLISSFVDFYYPDIYKINQRKFGQKDKIQVLFCKNNNIKNFNLSTKVLNIDLSILTNNDRIKYLKGEIGTFKQDKTGFKKEISKLYSFAEKKVQGADIYSLFKEKINDNIISEQNKKEYFRHILLLFTDGYIECGNRQRIGNKTYFLDQKLINEFKRKYIKSLNKEIPTKQNLKDFFYKEQYGLVPLENNFLENLEVLALEFYDRSETRNSSIKKRPSDLEIINLFWEDWMKKSKVKKFKSYKYFGEKKDFKKSVIDFIK